MDLSQTVINSLGMHGTLNALYTTLFKIDGDFIRMYNIDRYVPGFEPAQNLSGANKYEHNAPRATFVLIHGIGLSSTYMLPLAEELSEIGKVLLFDLPGFGNLPLSKKPQTIERLATLICKALSFTDTDNTILIGHSMGAQIAVEMMAQNHNFTRACLIGPPVNVRERSITRVFLRYLQSSVHEKAGLVRVAVNSYLHSVKSWLFRLLPKMYPYPIEDRISEVNSHSLIAILGGEYDYLAPRYWLEQLADCAAGEAWIKRIPKAAHSTVYSSDKEVADTIRHLVSLNEIIIHEDYEDEKIRSHQLPHIA